MNDLDTELNEPNRNVAYGTGLVDRMNLLIHARRYLKLVARRFLLMLATILIGLGVSSYNAWNTPNTYQASSKLGIAMRVEVNTPEVQENMASYYEDQIQYMRGGRVLDAVNQRMKDFKTMNGAAPSVTINATRMGVTSFFQMIVTSTDFTYAQRYAQVWAEEFLKFKDMVKGKTVEKSANNILKEKLLVEQELEKVQSDLITFTKKYNIASAKDVGDAAEDRLRKVQEEYTQLGIERKKLENITKENLATGMVDGSLRKPAERTGTGGKESDDSTDPLAKFSDANYSSLIMNLKGLQMDWERLSGVLKPKHPHMAKLRADIDRIKQQVDIQLDLIENKRLARVESLHKQEASYVPVIEELKKTVFDSRTVQREYEAIKEQEVRKKTTLDDLNKRIDTINQTSGSEETIEIIEKGVGSPMPIGPNRPKMILMGLMMGLVVGLGIIYLLHRLDDRLDLAEDIEEELQEPILGQVPQVNAKEISEHGLLISQMKPHGMYAESLRGIRSALLFGLERGKKHVILVTSAMPGDGKTSFTINFATILANAGHKVLLVDADLRRGMTHTYFDKDRTPGLAEVLKGEWLWPDVMRLTGVKNMSVIHTGELPSNPGELLISPAAAHFVEEAKEEYDYIIFDCPPLTSIDDAFSLAGLADGVLFVIRAGQTSIRFAKNALSALHQRGAKIYGIVINGITSDNPYYYYSQYYHAYYNNEEDGRPEVALTAQNDALARRRKRERPPSIVEEARALAAKDGGELPQTQSERERAERFKARRTGKGSPSDAPPKSGVPPEASSDVDMSDEHYS